MESDNRGGTPRRMANSVDTLRTSSPGGSSFEPSVSSSYGIDMIVLTGMSRKGSKIEVPLSGKTGLGEQAVSAEALGIVHGVKWD
jgi:hypothetical protein